MRAPLIDPYVLGARVAPVAVIAFSLFLAISAWIPFSEWPVKLVGGSAFLALGAFVLAQLARDMGKAIEGPLWSSWGGPPTVRMLRHRDQTFPPGIKAQLHRHLVDLGIVDHLPSEEEECHDPARADALYSVCSNYLRRKALELRSRPPFDVVHHENVSYGYRRNILGMKPYGLFVVGLALVSTITSFFFHRLPLIEIGGIVVLAMYLVFGVTEASLRRIADEYSKRLLDAAQSLPSPNRAGKRDSRDF